MRKDIPPNGALNVKLTCNDTNGHFFASPSGTHRTTWIFLLRSELTASQQHEKKRILEEIGIGQLTPAVTAAGNLNIIYGRESGVRPAPSALGENCM